MSTTATTTGGTTGQQAGGVWVSITQAGAILNLTERSIRRGIASGKYVTAIRDGKRIIRIEGEPAGMAGGNRAGQPAGGGIVEIKGGPTGTAGGEQAIVRQAVEAIVEQHGADLRRARRSAAWGWSLTAAAGILLAVGAVWGVRAVAVAQGQAWAADAARAILADDLRRERERADQLAGEAGRERQRADSLRDELHREHQRQAVIATVELLDSIP